MRHWKIDAEHVVTECETWEDWMDFAHPLERLEEFYRLCRVGETYVDTDVRVSTVFLRGIDHSTMPDWDLPTHVPLLFETMIFGGPHDQAQWRYATWAEAAAGHAEAVALALGTPVA